MVKVPHGRYSKEFREGAVKMVGKRSKGESPENACNWTIYPVRRFGGATCRGIEEAGP